MTKPGFSPLEKFSILCMVFAAIFLIYSSFMPVINALSGRGLEQQNFIINLTVLLIGICALWGGFSLVKKAIVMEQLIDMGFENGIYSRLEPLLREIAGSQVTLSNMEEQLKSMNLNIGRLRKRSVELNIPGSVPAFGIDIRAEVSCFLRYVILINMTLAAFLFLLNFTRSYTPFLLTILYVLWWLDITYEYNLWHKSSAWYWIFLPILIIPITTILGDVLYGSEVLIGGMGIGLAIYAGAYFTWSKYIIEGTLPFDINEHITDNRHFSYLTLFKEHLIRKRQIIAISLIACSIIFSSLLVLQIISVNIFKLEWLPKFSIDQLFFMGILSIIFYLSGTRLRNRKNKSHEQAV